MALFIVGGGGREKVEKPSSGGKMGGEGWWMTMSWGGLGGKLTCWMTKKSQKKKK